MITIYYRSPYGFVNILAIEDEFEILSYFRLAKALFLEQHSRFSVHSSSLQNQTKIIITVPLGDNMLQWD